MDRFWMSPECWKSPFALSGDEAHHCRRVMRKREGDWVEVFDGRGRFAEAVISGFEGGEVQLELGEERMSEAIRPEVELAVGIPKGKTMDLIVQKAVELGVSRIQPLLSDQGMVRLDAGEVKKKAEKWNRLALESCKQCGQNWLPVVAEPREMKSWMGERGEVDVEMAGALVDGARPLRELLEMEVPKSVRVWVGPEGDFSREEYEMIKEGKVEFVSLGDLVLKVETAAFFLLSSIFCQWRA